MSSTLVKEEWHYYCHHLLTVGKVAMFFCQVILIIEDERRCYRCYLLKDVNVALF